MPDNFWATDSGILINRKHGDPVISKYEIFDGEYVAGVRNGRGISLAYPPASEMTYFEGFWKDGQKQG